MERLSRSQRRCGCKHVPVNAEDDRRTEARPHIDRDNNHDEVICRKTPASRCVLHKRSNRLIRYLLESRVDRPGGSVRKMMEESYPL